MNLQPAAKILFLNKSLRMNEGARQWCADVKKVVENNDLPRGLAALELFEKQLGAENDEDWKELEKTIRGEVLLRAGVLKSWIGSAQQIEGELEHAKDMLSAAMNIFEQSEQTSLAAEAQIELGFLYWRGGEDNEARVMLTDALAKLTDDDKKLKAVALIRLATSEWTSNRFNDTLHILQSARTLFDEIDNAGIKGRYHNLLGITYEELGESEERRDYFALARIEYEAARLRFEQANNTRFVGYVENNLGYLAGVLGDFKAAARHLDQARLIFKELQDLGCQAQVNETRAQVLLMQDKAVQAEWRAATAVSALQRGDQSTLLSEALVTHGRAAARMGLHQKSLRSFQKAYEAATRAGNSVQAGNACLALVEELSNQMTTSEIFSAYEKAAELLQESRHLATLKKLQKIGLDIVRSAHDQPEDNEIPALIEIKPNFNLKKAVDEYEGKYIKRAWELTGGQMNQAAKLLGMKGHQTLSYILAKRQKNLLGDAYQPLKRLRSIINHPPRRKRTTTKSSKVTDGHV